MRTQVCGIFGFALNKPMSIVKVFRLLEKLEVHQYPQEPRPVGGFGTGLAILRSDNSIIFEKTGKTSEISPTKLLANIFSVHEASVLIGHVRMPSPEFMTTARFKETAQPYIVKQDKLTVVSVHNGKVENYRELRAKLGRDHVFESDKVELIDSEVIPHLFIALLNQKAEVNEALKTLSFALGGSNAIGMLQVTDGDAYLHFIHQGKTRGLSIWTNEQDELIFCSRKEPLVAEFGQILSAGEYEEIISISWNEERNLHASFALKR